MRTLYHGVDLHSTNFKTHFIDEKNDVIIKRGSMSIYNCEIEKKFIPMLSKNDYVCLEASTGAFKFAKTVKPYVKEVIIINPFDFKSLYMSGKKTDKIDAKKLCERLYTHIQSRKLGFEDIFPSVYIPEDHIIELRGLFSTYETLKRQITGLKNRIHSLLKQNLITYDSNNLNKSINNILNKKLIKSVYELQIKILLNQINNLNNDVMTIEREIKDITYKYHKEELLILISIMGISFFTGCAIISDIAEVNRFKKSKQFCSYLRAGMRVDSSNDKAHVGKLNKKSRKLSFKMILQGLQHIVRYNNNYYDFRQRKLKGKSNGKVRCALVRKTMVAIFYMLKNKEKWRYCTEEKYREKLSLLNCEVKKINLEKKRA